MILFFSDQIIPILLFYFSVRVISIELTLFQMLIKAKETFYWRKFVFLNKHSNFHTIYNENLIKFEFAEPLILEFHLQLLLYG